MSAFASPGFSLMDLFPIFWRQIAYCGLVQVDTWAIERWQYIVGISSGSRPKARPKLNFETERGKGSKKRGTYMLKELEENWKKPRLKWQWGWKTHILKDSLAEARLCLKWKRNRHWALGSHQDVFSVWTVWCWPVFSNNLSTITKLIVAGNLEPERTGAEVFPNHVCATRQGDVASNVCLPSLAGPAFEQALHLVRYNMYFPKPFPYFKFYILDCLPRVYPGLSKV